MIYFLTDPAEKASVVSLILSGLPEWFGIPESVEAYVDGSRDLPCWVAYESDDPIGFITLKGTSPYTAEIHVMGVLKEKHGQGTGTALWEAFRAWAKEQGYEYAQVKTVRRGCYAEYDRTNDFYEHLGFRALECFPTLWDEKNPCQVYIRSL